MVKSQTYNTERKYYVKYFEKIYILINYDNIIIKFKKRQCHKSHKVLKVLYNGIENEGLIERKEEEISGKGNRKREKGHLY